MRLIDIDAFMEEHKHHWDCLSANDMYWKDQLENRTPTIDAVEVVRCCDCKYFINQYTSCDGHSCGPFCDLSNGLNDPYGQAFCSYGKRME